MEQIAAKPDSPEPPRRMIGHDGPLPDDRAEWDDEAQLAYSWVLHQLDAWCRERRHPRHGNSGLAEEAIRRAW